MSRLKVLSASNQEPSYSNDWMDYMDQPFIQSLIKNSRQIGYGALVLLLIVILSYRFLSYRSSQDEKDFIAASVASQEIKDPAKQADSLKTLQALLNDHPNLQAKYDGLVGQTLLTQGKIEEAKPYIERTLKRVKNEASAFDQDYANTSLLISEGNLDEALKNAYLLKEKMAEANSPASTLYAFNLIRIAFLESDKGMQQKAWAELKALKGISSYDFNRVMTHFDDEGASLKDYIK